MRFGLIGVVVVGSCLAFPMLSRADTVSGPYVNLGVGVNFLQDEHVSGMVLAGVPTSRYTGQAGFDAGFVGIAAFGWGFGSGLRAELEGDYRYNDISHLPGATTSGGSEQKYGAMVNLLYDFNLAGR